MLANRATAGCRNTHADGVGRNRPQHSQQRIDIATAQRNRPNRATAGAESATGRGLQLGNNRADLGNLLRRTADDQPSRMSNHRRRTFDIAGKQSLQRGNQCRRILSNRNHGRRLAASLAVQFPDHSTDLIMPGLVGHDVNRAETSVLVDHRSGEQHGKRLGNLGRIGRPDLVDLQVRLVVFRLLDKLVGLASFFHVDRLDRRLDHRHLQRRRHHHQRIRPVIDGQRNRTVARR